MQNFKKIMLNLCSAVIFFTCLFVMPSIWMAEGADVPPQIFVGNTPTPIIVQRGDPVEVPIFFVGGTYIDREVELYVFTVDDEEKVVCFGPNGWESYHVVDFENYKSFCNLPGLPEYLYFPWRAFEDSQSLSNFDLWVCVDDQIDGILTETSSHCGYQSIIIEEVNGDIGDTEETVDEDVEETVDEDVEETVDEDVEETVDGDFQLPTPPSFPGFGGDLNSPCNSLKFTPEGTTSSSSTISKSLALGESEQITLLTLACGKLVPVSSVTKTCGGKWLSVHLGEESKIVLNLNTTGLEAGSINRCTITIVAGGITDNIKVTLRVEDRCDAASALVSPSSLSFHSYVGGQNPGTQILHVRDNCGQVISATASSNRKWLTVKEMNMGVFSVSCSKQPKGTYSGTIVLTDSYGQHSILATLKVMDTSSNGRVTTLTSGQSGYYDIRANQIHYFKFVAGVSDHQHPIYVANTPQSRQPRTVHALVKRGSMPTIADFRCTWEMEQSQSGTANLYWNYNTGSQTELVQIKDLMESSTFYIMLYNYGASAVQDQCLSVHYYD